MQDAADALLQQAVSRASVTREVDVGVGAIDRLPYMLSRLSRRSEYRLVADRNTMSAAGERVLAVLEREGIATPPPVVLDEVPRVKPRTETALDLARHLSDGATMPIAVGSGVINDITKYAARVANVPYVSVVTAASMDGYAASGAALLDGGFKRTLDCPPPVGVVADLDVVAHAPPRMAGWGYGDLSGKLVAGADWVLADALGEDPIDCEPFARVQDNIGAWLAGPDGIARGDRESLRGLVVGLLVSGFAMQAHGNSRPASGSDHQFAHLWEMERVAVDGEPVAHGACVGIGTVAMLAMYEWFLAQNVRARAWERRAAPPDDRAAVEAELTAAFSDRSLRESARVEMQAKQAASSRRPVRMHTLAESWPSLRERLGQRLLPAVTMQQRLAACGATAHPEHLGVSLDKLATDYRRARLIRRRYTLLDCLEDLGWLDRAIEALFAAGGFWGTRAQSFCAAPRG
jgi:glycerol-1-phosphate dehydrogenase [NAD(P)+]